MYPIHPLQDDYIEKHTSEEHPILKKIYRETFLNQINPRMVSGHLQGTLLTFLAKMIKPEKVLEIGTFTGYSAISLALGLSPTAILHTIDVNDEYAEVAQYYFDQVEVGKQIKLHVGNAIDVIPVLNTPFDLIYIDGEKREYTSYYNICKQYLNTGGYLIADNVLWNGKVFDILANDDATQEIRKFNDMLHSDAEFENVLLPIRDGLLVGRKVR